MLLIFYKSKEKIWKTISNLKNRFKILKGGGVSLIVSSLLISSSLVSVSNATTCEEITTQKTTTQNLCKEPSSVNEAQLVIRYTGSIITTNSRAITALSLVEYNTILNEGTIHASKSDIQGGALNTILVELQQSTHKLNLTNRGTIEAKIDEKLHSFTFALDLKNPANGTINVYNQSSGVIRGNVNVQGTLINQGVVELPYNAANSAIAKIKKFDNYSDGILRVGFDTDGTKDNTSYSKLLSETAIFYDNSAIDVNVLDSSTNVWNLVAGTSVQNNIDNSINLHSNNLNYHLKTIKFL